MDIVIGGGTRVFCQGTVRRIEPPPARKKKAGRQLMSRPARWLRDVIAALGGACLAESVGRVRHDADEAEEGE
jgi:hypothetical protein